MRRILSLVFVLAIVAAACQTTPKAETLLVVIDGSGSVAVIRTDGSVVTEVTASATQRHFQPIWVDTETIAYATTEEGAHRLSAIDLAGEARWSVEYPAPVFFVLPSPDGSQMATLRSSVDGSPIVAELWSATDGIRRIGNEAPFYLAWSPDGDDLVAHIGGSRLETIGSDTTVIEDFTGLYQAPYWSPLGIVGLRTVGGEQRIAVWQHDEPRDVALVRGRVRFVGSADIMAIATEREDAAGERALAQSLPRIPPGQLSILDLGDGSVTRVSGALTPLFQWDRRAEHLLFATITEDPAPQLQWHVWEDGSTSDYASFNPEPSWLNEFVPFFDQYAPTTFLWSPDGDAFAYPAMIDGQARIMLQRLDSTDPVELSSGSWVSWSR